MNPEIIKSIVAAKNALPTGQSHTEKKKETKPTSQMSEQESAVIGSAGKMVAGVLATKAIADVVMGEIHFKQSLQATRSGNLALQQQQSLKEKQYSRNGTTAASGLATSLVGMKMGAVGGPMGMAVGFIGGAAIGVGGTLLGFNHADDKQRQVNELTIEDQRMKAEYYRDLYQINLRR